MMLLKNSDGKPDGMFTCAIISLACVLWKFLMAGVSFKGVTLGVMPDAAVVGATLVPTLGAYCHRRWSDGQYDAPANPPVAK